MGKKGNACRLVVGKLEGKRPLERSRSRWMDNIKIYLGKIRWGDVHWICRAQDRDKLRALVNSAMHFSVSKNAGKRSNGYTSGGLSSGAQLYIVSYLLNNTYIQGL
jgi:hypothetical protein